MINTNDVNYYDSPTPTHERGCIAFGYKLYSNSDTAVLYVLDGVPIRMRFVAVFIYRGCHILEEVKHCVVPTTY